MQMSNKTVGLFGTCNNVNWRKAFIEQYESMNIPYFNPMKEDWTPKDAKNEAKHLKNDDIIAIPVLNSSYGIASLCEMAIASTRAILENKALVVLIDENVDDSLHNEELVKISNNTRSIIKQHMLELSKEHSQIIVATSLHEMLSITKNLALGEEVTQSTSNHLENFIRISEQKLEYNLANDPEKERRLAEQTCLECFYTSTFGGCAMTKANCKRCNKEMNFGSTNVDIFCHACGVETHTCVHCGKEMK